MNQTCRHYANVVIVIILLTIAAAYPTTATIDLNWGPYPGQVQMMANDAFLVNMTDVVAQPIINFTALVQLYSHTTVNPVIVHAFAELMSANLVDDYFNTSNTNPIQQYKVLQVAQYIVLQYTDHVNNVMFNTTCGLSGAYPINRWVEDLFLNLTMDLGTNVVQFAVTWANMLAPCELDVMPIAPPSSILRLAFTMGTAQPDEIDQFNLYVHNASLQFNNGTMRNYSMNELSGNVATSRDGLTHLLLTQPGAQFVSYYAADRDFTFCEWDRPRLPVVDEMVNEGSFVEAACLDGNVDNTNPALLADYALFNITVRRFTGCCWASQTAIHGVMLRSNTTGFIYSDLLAVNHRYIGPFYYHYNTSNVNDHTWLAVQNMSINVTHYTLAPGLQLNITKWAPIDISISFEPYIKVAMAYASADPHNGIAWSTVTVLLDKASCYNVYYNTPKVKCFYFSTCSCVKNTPM